MPKLSGRQRSLKRRRSGAEAVKAEGPAGAEPWRFGVPSHLASGSGEIFTVCTLVVPSHLASGSGNFVKGLCSGKA